MTISIKSNPDGISGAIQVGGVDVFKFGSDTSGQLAGFRNILINGKLTINQRGVTIAAAANGAYGPDRWKKVDASNMTQIVEAGNFKPSTVYTLSGINVVEAQITSPASGDWNIGSIPITASYVQLEEGSIATPFEQRPVGLELSLCQRYYERVVYGSFYIPATAATIMYSPHYFKVSKRVTPTVTLPPVANQGYSAAGNQMTPTSWTVSVSQEGFGIQVGGASLGGHISNIATASAEL